MADRRKFSNDEFDDIDIDEELEDIDMSDEEIEYLNVSFDEDDEEVIETVDEEEKPKRKVNLKVIIPIALVVIAVCAVAIYFFTKEKPNKTREDLFAYYGITEGSSDLAIIVDHNKIDEKGYLIDGECYIPETVVSEFFTDKLYIDADNRVVLYTTPYEVWSIPYGAQYYEDSSSKIDKEYVIVRVINNTLYVNAQFIKELTGCQFTCFAEPSRVAIETAGKDFMSAELKQSAKVRTKASIRGTIIGDASETVKWYKGTEDADDGWVSVCSEDGRSGFVKAKEVGAYIDVAVKTFEAMEYPNQLRDHKIVLVWDAIYVKEENAKIKERLDNVTNVNVISPTWYKIGSTEGEIVSLADKEYLDYVRGLGLEVWPLISDFDAGKEDGFDEAKLLSTTEYRRTLIKNIMDEIHAYGFEGINIDFEKIREEYGKDFVQFVRELSIECRKSNVVLSIDNYVPFKFREYYGFGAQGECIDYVIVMCYDEHYDGGEKAGSTASISYVQGGMDKTLAFVDKEKILVGVPFYSRLWQLESTDYEVSDEETSGNIISTKAFGMAGGQAIAKELELKEEWNDTLKQTVASGISNGYFYQIWLETLESMGHKLKVITDADVAGTAAWALNNADRDVWTLFAKFNS